MTERKLVKQGRNALTMTLPASWIQKNNLTEKDVVHIEEVQNQIVVKTNNEKQLKEISLNFENITLRVALHLVLSSYIQGYDRIIINYNNLNLANRVSNMNLLGLIIEEQTENTLILKDMIQVPQDNFKQLFRRSCTLLIQHSKELHKLTSQKTTKDDVKRTERILDQNLFYCMRYINKYENIDESHKKFLLISTIEEIGDIISKMRLYITNEQTLTKNLIELIEIYVQSILLKDFNKIHKALKQFKDNINKQTFVEGLAFSTGEIMKNYLGYLIDDKSYIK